MARSEAGAFDQRSTNTATGSGVVDGTSGGMGRGIRAGCIPMGATVQWRRATKKRVGPQGSGQWSGVRGQGAEVRGQWSARSGAGQAAWRLALVLSSRLRPFGGLRATARQAGFLVDGRREDAGTARTKVRPYKIPLPALSEPAVSLSNRSKGLPLPALSLSKGGLL